MLEHLIRPQYPSDEVRFGLYNAHPEEHVERLAAVVRGQAAERVVLLRGGAGIGRSYLVAAAAHRVRTAGQPVEVLRLDLEGWDDEPRDGLERYVEQLLDKRGMLHAGSREKWLEGARAVAELAGKAGLKATLLGLLIDAPGRLETLAQLLGTRLPGDGATPSAGPARDVGEILDLLLDQLRQRATLVVHVTDVDLLPLGAVRTLLFGRAQARQIGGERPLALALSCPPAADASQLRPHLETEPLILDLEPHDRASLMALLDRRFSPGRFVGGHMPSAVAEAILTTTAGIPGKVANKLHALIHGGALIEDRHGVWTLPEDGLGSLEIRRLLGRSLGDEIESQIQALPHYQDNVRDFLRYGALCGELIPAELVLGAMGLIEERQQDVLDLIDEQLVDAELPLLIETDVQYRAFPSISIYRFASPLLRQTVIDQLDDGLRSDIAGSLLGFLEPRLPKTSRAEARLLLEVARHLDDDAVSRRYRTVLGVWVAVDETHDVGEELARWLISAEADPDVLWLLAHRTRDRWPPQRRVLLLDQYRAIEEGRPSSPDRAPGLPDERLASFFFTRAEALLASARYGESENDAREASEHYAAQTGPHSDPVATTQTLLGEILRRAGRLDDSRAVLEAALEIRHAVHSAPDIGTAVTGHALAETLHAQGETEKARQLFETTLALCREIYGSDRHPHIAVGKWRLARSLRDLGRSGDARVMLEDAIATAQQTLGEQHPATRKMASDLAAKSETPSASD